METLPTDVLQRILCRVTLIDVFRLKAASSELSKVLDFTKVKEISELARGVYWQSRSPAFAVMVGSDADDDRDSRSRIFVMDTKGDIFDNMMPEVRGPMEVETTCKGLVLASIPSFNEREIKLKGCKRLFVFNLSAGSSVEIPRTPRHCNLDEDDDCLECRFSWYSMGFDVETSVCTVIRIALHHSRRMTVIDIYSSETRQWKTLDFPPIFPTASPLYSKGSFFFPYSRCYRECTRIGVFTAKDCTFNSVSLPVGGGDHYDRAKWTFHGREDHLTLVFQNNFINRRDSKRGCWNFKEEVLFRSNKENELTTPLLDQGSIIVSCDANCWENCNPETTKLVELGNAIHSEKDHYDRVNWTFRGRGDGDHLTLVYQNNYINLSDSKRDCWNFKEEVFFRSTKENNLSTPLLDHKSIIVSCDANCWENCNPRTTKLVELGNAIHSEKDVFSEGGADYILDYDTCHLGITWSWKDSPDDKFRVYNVKGEVVNTLTFSHLHSMLGLPPIVDEDEMPEKSMSLVYIWPLEINNIAWPWPQHDYESFMKLEWMDDAGMPDSHP